MWWNILFYLVLLLVVAALIWVIGLKRRSDISLAKIKNIKTGKPVPSYGVFQMIWHTIRYSPETEEAQKKLITAGKVFGSYLFIPAVTFTEPEHAKQILKMYNDGIPKQRNFIAARARLGKTMDNILKMIGANSVISVNAPEWDHQRTLLNRAFTSPKVFFQVMKKKAELCIDIWKKEAKSVKVGYDLQKMTLDVLACTIFGMDFDTLSGTSSAPLEAYHHCISNIFNPIRILCAVYRVPLLNDRNLNKSVDLFDSYCWKIINETKEKMGVTPDKPETAAVEEEKETSIIKLMIESGMELQTIRDNISTFFIAGHETTAITLTYAVGILALYPDIQQKLRNEVNTVAPDELTYDSLKDLTYVDCFIKEVMRYHPAVTAIRGRQTDRDVVIGDYLIPTGTIVQMDIYTMAHDPKIWGDPEVFRPERFLNDQLTKEQRNAYIPFSSGPRFCIGMSFSLEEQKVFLATLVKIFSSITMGPGSILKRAKKGFLNNPDFDALNVNFK